ncbi:MAG: hypothetical protein JWO59_2792 [Chloroflexi bacterium]|nr:hypothetical protein [Chloroflexota bacterium]
MSILALAPLEQTWETGRIQMRRTRSIMRADDPNPRLSPYTLQHAQQKSLPSGVYSRENADEPRP